jgi:hypothetical protein
MPLENTLAAQAFTYFSIHEVFSTKPAINPLRNMKNPVRQAHNKAGMKGLLVRK